MSKPITQKRLKEKYLNTEKQINKLIIQIKEEKEESKNLQSLSRKHMSELTELQNKLKEINELIKETENVGPHTR